MLNCIIVTPERTVRETPAEFVALTLFDGEIGIGPRHTPLIGRLGYGEMRVTDAGKTDRYYVEGGFVEVLEDVVTVITQRAVPAGEIDAAVALEQLQSAQTKPGHSAELLAIRDRAVAISRSQLRVARRARDEEK